MQDYISGILEENVPVEMYHGLPFSRRLVVRTLNGKALEIADTDAIANDLQPGKTVKLVVAVAGVDRVRAFTHSKTLTARFSGMIRATKWEPAADEYLACNENLMQEPMSVIGTAYGHVLLSRMLLGGVAVGNAVTWGRDEFKLVAIYK